MPSPHRLLIVGAGLTGSVTASLLRRKFPKHLLDITVWEKSRGAGGRMNTYRRPTDSRATVDLGAQYISASSTLYARSHERYIAMCDKPLLLNNVGFFQCVHRLPKATMYSMVVLLRNATLGRGLSGLGPWVGWGAETLTLHQTMFSCFVQPWGGGWRKGVLRKCLGGGVPLGL